MLSLAAFGLLCLAGASADSVTMSALCVAKTESLLNPSCKLSSGVVAGSTAYAVFSNSINVSRSGWRPRVHLHPLWPGH